MGNNILTVHKLLWSKELWITVTLWAAPRLHPCCSCSTRWHAQKAHGFIRMLLCNGLSFPRTWGFPNLFRIAKNISSEGGKKRGEEDLTNDTPPKKGFWTPPLERYVFHPPRVSLFCFSCTKSTTEQTRSSFGGVQNFSGGGTFSSLHTFCTPPYHGPISQSILLSMILLSWFTFDRFSGTLPKPDFCQRAPVYLVAPSTG